MHLKLLNLFQHAFFILKHSWYINNFHIVLWDSTRTYLLWQILIVFLSSLLLWMDLHVKLEPSFHSCIFGSISLLRLKVGSTFSTLCSFLWFWALLRDWLSRCHATLSVSGKKPLKVQMSLTGEAPNVPSQTGRNVMFGETTRGSEIEKIVISFICLNVWCEHF